jgi:hypothetical protein
VQIDADAAFGDVGLDAGQVLGRGERGLERLRNRFFEHLRLDATIRDVRAHVWIDDAR